MARRHETRAVVPRLQRNCGLAKRQCTATVQAWLAEFGLRRFCVGNFTFGNFGQGVVSMRTRTLFTATALAALISLGAYRVSAQPQPSDASEQSQQDQNQQQDNQDRNRQQQSSDQNQQHQSDDDSTEYHGHERAGLGVLLSENRNGHVSVSRVISGSPAEKAGLRRGDQISQVDDQDVNSYRDVIRLINRKNPNEQIDLTVQRNGQQRQLNVSLEPRQDVFDQNQQYAQGQSHGANNGRWNRDQQNQGQWEQGQGSQQTSRRESWQSDRGNHQDYGRYQARRDQTNDQFGRQSGWQDQWQQDGNRYGNNQQQYNDRSNQYGRSNQGQYDRTQYNRDQYSQQTAGGDNYPMNDSNNQYGRRNNWQNDRYGQQGGRPSLGIGLRSDNGALQVSRVYQNSPAEEAGLRRGDEIVSLEGRQVQSYDQLLRALNQHQAGDHVTLGILRNGRRQQVNAQLQDTEAYTHGGPGGQQDSAQYRQNYNQNDNGWNDADRWGNQQGYSGAPEQRTGGRQFNDNADRPYGADGANRDF
jgi:C-terminal processing protease CtpA/Prc